jgi:hypothetical protein
VVVIIALGGLDISIENPVARPNLLAGEATISYLSDRAISLHHVERDVSQQDRAAILCPIFT